MQKLRTVSQLLRFERNALTWKRLMTTRMERMALTKETNEQKQNGFSYPDFLGSLEMKPIMTSL